MPTIKRPDLDTLSPEHRARRQTMFLTAVVEYLDERPGTAPRLKDLWRDLARASPDAADTMRFTRRLTNQRKRDAKTSANLKRLGFHVPGTTVLPDGRGVTITDVTTTATRTYDMDRQYRISRVNVPALKRAGTRYAARFAWGYGG